MRKSIFPIILLLLLNAFVNAQTVTVTDKSNLQPIENVFVFTSTHSGLTNDKGQLDLSNFPKTEAIHFQHASYMDFAINMGDLKKQNMLVELDFTHVKIDEIVIAGNRWEANRMEVPAKIVSISPKQTALDNPQTAADLLSTSGHVFVQKSQLGGGSPMIRGFSTNRILIVVDGVRMNNAIFRSGNLQNVISVDPLALERSEIIMGPGSVLYGSDALGGVMDFHTLTPKFSYDEKLNVKGNIFTRLTSANNEQTVHGDLNIGFKKVAFITSFTRSSFGDLKMGSDGGDYLLCDSIVVRRNNSDIIIPNSDKEVQRSSGYDQFNFLHKVKWQVSEKANLDYTFYYSETSDVPRYDATRERKGNEFKFADYHYGPQKWMLNTLSYTSNYSNRLADRFRVVLAHQDYEESRINRKFNKDDIKTATENVNILSLNMDIEKKLGNESSIFYGAEAYHNLVGSETGTFNWVTGEIKQKEPRYPDDSKYGAMAVYANYKRNFGTDFTFNAGSRLSHVYLNADLDTSLFEYQFTEIKTKSQSLTGSLGLVYHPNDRTQLNLYFSSGFRAPNLDDAGKIYEGVDNSVVVPNEDLSSEYAYNSEISLLKNFANVIRLELAVFYTRLEDAMVRRPFEHNGANTLEIDGETYTTLALVNEDKADIYGAQFALFGEISRFFTGKFFLNYTKGEDEEGNALRHVPPFFSSLHLMYKYNRFNCDLYGIYNGGISAKNLAVSEQGKEHMYAKDENGNLYSPDWYTVNFKSSFQLNKTLQITAGIENILDKRYRPYSSGIVAPGRNFVFGIKGVF